MNNNTVKQAITPLRLIFWGGLLCILDVTFGLKMGRVGFKFDVLNDALGTFLIAVGVFRLSPLPVHERYATVMKFVKLVSVLAVLDAIRGHFSLPLPSVVYFLLSLLGLVTLASIVVFCVAMRWFCEEAKLLEAFRSWSITTVLFIVIYLIPLGLIYIVSAVAIASGTSFNYKFGPAVLPVLLILTIPLIHLFMSTSRMKRAAEEFPVED